MGFIDSVEFDSVKDGDKLIESTVPFEGYLHVFEVNNQKIACGPSQEIKIDNEWRPAVNVGLGQKATFLSDKGKEVCFEITFAGIEKFRGRLKFVKNKEYLANGFVVRNK